MPRLASAATGCAGGVPWSAQAAGRRRFPAHARAAAAARRRESRRSQRGVRRRSSGWGRGRSARGYRSRQNGSHTSTYRTRTKSVGTPCATKIPTLILRLNLTPQDGDPNSPMPWFTMALRSWPQGRLRHDGSRLKLGAAFDVRPFSQWSSHVSTPIEETAFVGGGLRLRSQFSHQ
jgi:hypothetical protein